MTGVLETVGPAEASLLPGDEEALEAFATAALRLAAEASLERPLAELVQAVARATGADLVIARLAEDGQLVARAVHTESAVLAAELEGSRIPAAEIGFEEAEYASAPGDPTAPVAVRRIAARAHTSVVRLVPVVLDGETAASLDLLKTGLPFGFRERVLARVAAAHLAAAARVQRVETVQAGSRADLAPSSLELAGDALAAGADEVETAEQVARLAAEATNAAGATVWRLEPDVPPTFLAAHGLGRDAPEA
ncbi:MAG: hypothetical protein ACRDM9_07860, partial [Gaiellaceae bacterium]